MPSPRGKKKYINSDLARNRVLHFSHTSPILDWNTIHPFIPFMDFSKAKKLLVTTCIFILSILSANSDLRKY